MTDHRSLLLRGHCRVVRATPARVGDHHGWRCVLERGEIVERKSPGGVAPAPWSCRCRCPTPGT